MPFGLDDPEPLIATVARLLAAEGAAREVAVLAHCNAYFEETGYDNWNGGTYSFALRIQIPPHLYAQVANFLSTIEANICEFSTRVLRSEGNEVLSSVVVVPNLGEGIEWRDRARA